MASAVARAASSYWWNFLPVDCIVQLFQRPILRPAFCASSSRLSCQRS